MHQQKTTGSAGGVTVGGIRCAEPVEGAICYFVVTAEVMEVITMDAILKASSRSAMW